MSSKIVESTESKLNSKLPISLEIEIVPLCVASNGLNAR